MQKNVTVYDLLISCPSDVTQYIDAAENVVHRFNRSFGQSHNIIVRTRHWSKDVWSQVGHSPQKTINNQIVDSSDMAIVVFWTRFGTSTQKYGSGTEEEIERLIGMKKQVFLYFLDKQINPFQIDPDQYKKVQDFMNKYRDKCVYFRVADENQLEYKFMTDLELYFQELTQKQKTKNSSGGIEILWVDDKPENNVYARNKLEQCGLSFVLALSTQQALYFMKNGSFALIISDMERKEGEKEGLILLEEVRKTDREIPFFLYTASKKMEYRRGIEKLGGRSNIHGRDELIGAVKNLLL